MMLHGIRSSAGPIYEKLHRMSRIGCGLDRISHFCCTPLSYLWELYGHIYMHVDAQKLMWVGPLLFECMHLHESNLEYLPDAMS